MGKLLLLYCVAASVLGLSSALYEDCEIPPSVKHAAIKIEDEEDVIRAIYTCKPGFELNGPKELLCDLDTDEWNADPPKCVISDAANEVDGDAKAKNKLQDIPEDRYVSPALASTLDMTCVQAKVKAPEIRHGFVQNYEKRSKTDRVFLVAHYGCKDNFEFEDSNTNTLYCSERKWVGELPVCVSVGEYIEGDDEEEYEEYEEEGENNETPTSISATDTTHTDNTESAEHPEEGPSNEISNNENKDISGSEVTNQITTGSETVEMTAEEYAPRFLDDNCGSDKGGCDHKCERLQFPGESEPRLRCSCFDGFQLDSNDDSTCHDIDECAENNGGCEELCQNFPGSFRCACQAGLQIDTLTGTTCVDINECLLRNGHGPCQDTCHNLWSGYRCSCDNLPGTQLSPDNRTCVDAGECAHNNGGCSHTCLSSLGRVFCLCPSGYHMTDNGKICKDINECEIPEIAAECSDGCENTQGSYRCITALNTREDVEQHSEQSETETGDNTVCGEGYRSQDGECIDIDECSEGTSGCQQCINTEGGYECTCPQGFDLAEDEKTCIDIDECSIVIEENEDEASYRLCSHGCQNTIGSFVCNCPPRMHLSDNSRTCLADGCSDLQNSNLNKTRCSYDCVDLPNGGYDCLCPEGYALANDGINCDQLEDTRVDICTERNGAEKCYPGTCQSYDDNSDFICVCPTGFKQEEKRCLDVDECSGELHECSHECMNTEGGYRCICPEGYQFNNGNDRECIDIDECRVDPDICGALQCVNYPGSFNCLCEDGKEPNDEGICPVPQEDSCASHRCSHECIPEGQSYRCACPDKMSLDQTGENCVASDLCSVNKNGCEHLCNSQEGGTCSCYDGYALDSNGKSCNDIDECLTNRGGCHQLCTNSAGGYSCSCYPGFEFLSGSLSDYCFDIDECSLGRHNCQLGMTCENLNGSYTCLCPEGYALGTSITIIPLSSIENFINSEDHSYNTSLSLTSSPSNSSSCLDIDECSIDNGGCSHFCINLDGSFECSCPTGYILLPADNKSCILIDQCLHGNGGCSHECTNANGQVKCSCPQGFSLNANNKQCQDINECFLTNGGCDHMCRNSAGSYSCSCHNGFILSSNGHSCLDFDECLDGFANCSSNCINLVGSYTCDCEVGFELADDKKTCLDVDECSMGRHECSHMCENVEGSFQCVCPDGYYLGEGGTKCLDVDECIVSDHGCSHQCYNTMGSYICACPEGQSLSEDGKTCLNSLCAVQNGGCSHSCDEVKGCTCPAGYILGDDEKTCDDIDECANNNGGCSFKCLNLLGSFECICPDNSKPGPGEACPLLCPAGFTFSQEDPSQCVDINECELPGVCQFNCRNTNGSYECLCPPGYKLMNGRNCIDVDECLVNNGGCVNGQCVNHNGGHECRCHVGYRLTGDRRTCEKHAEMRDHCPPFQAPLNGAMHCTKYRHKKKLFYNTRCKLWCNQGYRLEGPSEHYCNASGQWDDNRSRCVPITCPRIPIPTNGVMLPSTCSLGKTFVGERCRLQCHAGLVPVGKSVAVCTSQMQWSYNGTFECTPKQIETRLGTASNGFTPLILQTLPTLPPLAPLPTIPLNRFDMRPSFGLHPRPFIKCPRNTTVYLTNGERTKHIILQKPITNMDYRYIESSPAWAKDLQAVLSAGSYVVSFRGYDPMTSKKARCKTVINVKHAETPKIEFCTPSFEVALRENQVFRSVKWEEPRFAATPGGNIKQIDRSRIPGELFGVGEHNVFYRATNENGFSAVCEFKIIVIAATSSSVYPTAPTLNLEPPHHTARSANLIYAGDIQPAAFSPVSHPSIGNAHLLAGHESFIVCPGQKPVKVTQAQTIDLPANCVLKNIRKKSLRQFMPRHLTSGYWSSYMNF